MMENGERVRCNDQTAARLASKFGHSRFDFARVANRGRRYLSCDWPRHGLERTQVEIILGGHVWVEHECGARNAGGRLLEHLQPFPHHLEIDEREASDVPARMRQARNEALLDGIVDRRHNDGNGACRLPYRPEEWRCLRNDYLTR